MIENKVVLITGAAGRIGSAIAKAVVAKNGKVILTDIDNEKGGRLVTALGEKNCIYIKSDITCPEDIDYLLQHSLERFGKIDAALHSAYPHSKKWGTQFERLQLDFVAEDLKLQLGSAIIFSQKIMLLFTDQGYGNLVHISSIQGVTAPKFDHYMGTNMTSPIEYSAIKAGIIAITRWLAKYYANKNIRVNCISPGGILAEQPVSFLEKYRESCTSKGMLEAEDITGAAIFLLSNESEYINGQNLIVDDGWSL